MKKSLPQLIVLYSTVEKAEDQPTLDLLTRRMEQHEKTAWMLRSLMEV